MRDDLIKISLLWQKQYGVAPNILSAVSEYDAAMMIGMPEDEYSDFMQDKTAVSKGSDFIFNNKRYQVKANRPSGKPGSKVTIVAKAKNYEWDYLIWILYNKEFQIKESWMWNQHDYKKEFDEKKRLSPSDYRRGKKLF
tara:strand:+ start:451 stop:867 length:417 start_codon:yes stop_codon:yes gene_type:complete